MKIIIVASLLLLVHQTGAQSTDRSLTEKIKPLLAGFHGDVGVYVKDLRKNRIVTIQADTLFPTASIVKIPILIGIMSRIEKSELNYHQDLLYRDSLLYAGEDILGSFADSQTITLNKVMMLMLTMSDNTASLWLQSLAGSGTRINQILDSLGYPKTRVNSRTEGRYPNWQQYGWGQTTPREIATLLEQIYQGKMISADASERMLRNLKRNFWDAQSLSQFPPTANTFSKNGAVDESRSEVVLVNSPHSDFVFAIMTKNNQDTSWTNQNEAWELTRQIARTLWQHFEPKSQWKPMDGEARDRWF